MAMMHGKAGSVSFTSGDFSEVVSWSVDASCDMADTTAMDASVYWKTYLAGFKDWTATVECKWSGSGLAALGTTATLTLTLVSGTTISGTAFLQNYGTSSEAEGVITQTYSFQGSGALS